MHLCNQQQISNFYMTFKNQNMKLKQKISKSSQIEIQIVQEVVSINMYCMYYERLFLAQFFCYQTDAIWADADAFNIFCYRR